jgi:hypothetical protein
LRQDGGSARGFRGFGGSDELKKCGGARAWAVRRGEIIIATQIPASIEALIQHARTPRGLIAARYAAKSEAA